MNKPNDKTNLLKETSVFDYVAGNLSERARANFEKLISQDPDLRHEVEVETALRAALGKQSANETSPISRSNFNTLLEKIDQSEGERKLSQVSDSAVAQAASSDTHSSASERSVASSVLGFRTRPKMLAMAASVALVAVVLSLSINSSIEPKFETLTNNQASEQVNLPAMVEQRRLAKLDISAELDDASLQGLLSEYQLTTVQAAPQGQSMLVSSAVPIDTKLIQRWRDDSRIVDAELVSFGSE